MTGPEDLAHGLQSLGAGVAAVFVYCRVVQNVSLSMGRHSSEAFDRDLFYPSMLSTNAMSSL